MAKDVSPLPALLVSRARRTSDSRLALDAGIGLLVATAIAAWRPAWWLLPLSGALCFASFGSWGIADRELREGHHHTRRLSVFAIVRLLSAITGTLAALVLMFGVLAMLLGTIIS